MTASAKTSVIAQILTLLVFSSFSSNSQESLPPLINGRIPSNLDELWGAYDPRSEPLEVEILKEWEERGVVARIVRYTVGTFKGGTSKVAAFYAFPKGARKLPGLLHLHGGGQSAGLAGVMADALNGYASVSINWGGNKMSVPTSVDPSGQWKGPQTDWGNLDATHPPQRNKANHFVDAGIPDEYTLDPVASPRNSNWFLVNIAARRALTFLQQQPEVDPDVLGVHGHSMGGRLTTEVAAIDKRVKAAVPSCGGSGVITEKPDDVPLGEPTKMSPEAVATFTTNPYLPRITCPTLWFSSSNDFHGLIDSMAWNWRQVPEQLLSFTIPPHFNHRASPPHQVASMLWFESHLKGALKLPAPPKINVHLSSHDSIPTVIVEPDASQTPLGIDVYYSVDSHVLTRFWRCVKAEKVGDKWQAKCPILSANQPLFAFANVIYATPEKFRNQAFPPGASNSTTFVLSSRPALIGASQLKAAGIKATDSRDRLIDACENDWLDWYRLEWGNGHLWSLTTRKVKDPKWRAPAGARLVFDVRCPTDNTVVVIASQNQWGVFPGKPTCEFLAGKHIKGSPDWQSVSISLDEMMPAKSGQAAMTSWEWITELSLRSRGTFFQDGKEIQFGQNASWPPPREFRNIRWEGGVYSTASDVESSLTEEEHRKGFNDAIQKSLDQEKLDQKAK